MALRKLLVAGAAATLIFSAGAANAALIFAGSWQLNDGPANASAASAQQIAAQLFGGDPADYFISTAGEQAGAIDNQAFYGILGDPGIILVGGEGISSSGSYSLSAYVGDATIEDRWVNYAFREGGGASAPEPSTWMLAIAGFGLAGAAVRRRRLHALG